MPVPNAERPALLPVSYPRCPIKKPECLSAVVEGNARHAAVHPRCVDSDGSTEGRSVDSQWHLPHVELVALHDTIIEACVLLLAVSPSLLEPMSTFSRPVS